MWRLLKAEFSYNLYVLAWQYLMLSLIFFSLANFRRYGYQVDPVVPLLIVVTMFSIFFSRRFTEARNRLFSVLPLDSRTTAIARLLFQLWYWIGVLIFYIASNVFYFQPAPNAIFIFRLFFWGSILLSSNAIYYISFDLWTGFSNLNDWLKSSIISCIWVYIILIGLFYIEDSSGQLITFDALQGVQQWFYFSWSGVFVQYLIGFGFSWGSISVYRHRKLYFV